MHRYITLDYNDFWTTLLDTYFDIPTRNRKCILEWGPEEFNKPIERCNNRFLKPIMQSMKLLYTKFVTPPETGDNRFIFQPIFRNKNITRIVKGKRRCLLQEDFGLDRQVTLCVNQCFNQNKFKTYDELSTMNPFPEGAYLLMKKILTETFSKKGKYPPPLINKSVQKWNIESIPKLFSIKKKG